MLCQFFELYDYTQSCTQNPELIKPDVFRGFVYQVGFYVAVFFYGNLFDQFLVFVSGIFTQYPALQAGPSLKMSAGHFLNVRSSTSYRLLSAS